MRKFLAILIGRLAGHSSRATGRGGGSTIPGLIAERIDPKIIAKLSKKIKNGVIIITGTNGKTTSAKMLAAILNASGQKVIYNFSGSNLSRGIASTLLEHTNFFGTKMSGDIAIFEVDEATMPEITSKVTPNIVIVTNLFRDQLDRYGELDKTAGIIGNSIKNLSKSKIFLNADDPLVTDLVRYNKNVVYFGINDTNIKTKSIGSIDSRNCLACGEELIFEPRYFGHLGIYHCSKCDYKRPATSYSLENIDLMVETSKSTFTGPNKSTIIQTAIPGLYNLYNALVAAAVASDLGIDLNLISTTLASVSAAFGRMEKIKIGNKNIFLLLVKNPTGFTQSIETLTYDNLPKNVLIALNDNFADGTDVSWIWDTEMELLREYVKNVMTTGIRAEDMFLRLKYADFDHKNMTIENDISKALQDAISKMEDGETLYVLPTYTAMLEIRKILTKSGAVKGLLE